MKELVVRPIGVVRSPFGEKVEAPRQARIAVEARGRIVIAPELEPGLDDLEGFERIWVLFWFDQAEMRGTKVQPPRSDRKRGVFATRSPHRPNPIGLSCVVLERREGNVLHVRELDMIDGTPVIDIKPYIAYADAFPEAKQGWLTQPTVEDPRPRWTVLHAPLVDEQLAWIAEHASLDLRARIDDALSLGPMPHPYRRIKKAPGGGFVLAVKEWRVRFRIEGQVVIVDRIDTGYRPKELPEVHRAFVEKFPALSG